MDKVTKDFLSLKNINMLAIRDAVYERINFTEIELIELERYGGKCMENLKNGSRESQDLIYI